MLSVKYLSIGGKTFEGETREAFRTKFIIDPQNSPFQASYPLGSTFSKTSLRVDTVKRTSDSERTRKTYPEIDRVCNLDKFTPTFFSSLKKYFFGANP